MNPKLVSLTGIDDFTDPDELGRLHSLNPNVEFGVLYMSGQKEGIDPRFPSKENREKFLKYRSNGQPLKLAAHLCGRIVFESILDPARRPAILEDIKRYDRVQLNVNARTKYFDDYGVDMIFTILNYHGITTILQMHDRSKPVVNKYLSDQEIHGEYSNVHVLFDKSCGFGRLPEAWEEAKPYNSTSFFGYAGGLGPDTLPAQMEAIHKAAGDVPYWIDMESGIRDQDNRFSVERAERVINFINSI